MLDDPDKHMSLDDRLESYAPFFDHAWAKEVFEAVGPAAKLGDFVFDLMISIKGLSRTSAIPLLAVNVAEAYSNGHQLEKLENSLTLKLINHLAERLDQRITLTAAEASEVRRVMFDLKDEAFEKIKGHSVEFPRQELWDGMVKIVEGGEKDPPKNEFRLGLWACQRICYSGLFFSYEDFLVRCVHTQSGKNTRSTNHVEFKKLCRDHLGDTLTESCWLDPKIVTAKHIRNSLAHAGGRETDDLKKLNHKIEVVEGKLQILPFNVKNLFAHLKPRIKTLVEWAAPLPAFS